MIFLLSHRLLCCTPLGLKKNFGQSKLLRCVCPLQPVVLGSKMTKLWGQAEYTECVAVASRKWISLMFWTHYILTTLKIFLLIVFDLGCVSVSSVELVSVILFCFPREELKLCRQNIESLMEQRNNLEKEIEQQKAADNRWVQKWLDPFLVI